jgi:DNA modification methylase
LRIDSFICGVSAVTETFLDGKVTLLVGDVRAKLRELPADHFDCVVTSPPYWGLRDYGTGRWEGGEADCDHRSPTMRDGRNEDRAKLPGSSATNSAQLLLAHRSACGKCGAVKVDEQIGLEPTLSEHLAAMVEVFREVRRVLKPIGVCWINYGDCYATSPNGRSAADTKAVGNDDRTFRDKPFSTIQGTLKAKDLCMVPERLFIALQDDGWWVRSKMPWIKRNGMPESITDRPANSLEQVALLTKSERYWYDAEAVRKPASPSTNSRVAQNVAAQAGSDRANGGAKTNGPMEAVVRFKKPGVTPKSAGEETNIRAKESWHASTAGPPLNDRNFRNTDLFFSSIDIPFGLISDADGTPLAIDANPQGFSEAHFATFPTALIEPLIMAGCPVGGEVLDPFGGSGTTALVATTMGRKATIIELNPEYATLARARIEAAFMGREEGARHMVKQLGKDRVPFEPGSLFAGIEAAE